MEMLRKVVILTLALALITQVASAQAPVEEGGEGDLESMDEYNDFLERLLATRNDKRSCIRRGGTCDHRPNDCCYQSSCRCNLWGSNCRCQRAGLFQQWGK